MTDKPAEYEEHHKLLLNLFETFAHSVHQSYQKFFFGSVNDLLKNSWLIISRSANSTFVEEWCRIDDHFVLKYISYPDNLCSFIRFCT